MVENRDFVHTHAFDAPVMRVLVVLLPRRLATRLFDDMFSRFNTIPVCDKRADGRTDERTFCDSIFRAIKLQASRRRCDC